MRLMRLIFIGLLSFSLVACGNNDEVEKAEDTEEEVETVEEETDSEAETEESDEESEEITEPGIVETYEEGAVIAEYIDLDDLSMKVNTDNPNTRVLFFHTDDYSKKYKTVYVKDKKRLKIIDERDDDLLFNDVID